MAMASMPPIQSISSEALGFIFPKNPAFNWFDGIVDLLRQAEVHLSQGMTVVEAVKQLGISEQTYYRWRRESGGLDKTQAKKLKDPEKENQELKKLVADLSLDNAILKRVRRMNALEKKPDRRREAVADVQEALSVSERREPATSASHLFSDRTTPLHAALSETAAG